MGALEAHLQALLLPKDPNEGRNVIVEIRGAEGGEEANLFARRPLRHVPAVRRRRGSGRSRCSSEDASDRDGINEAVFMVKGPDAWPGSSTRAGPTGSSVCP